MSDFVAVKGGPPPVTVQAWAIDYDGEVAAVVGAATVPGAKLIFSHMREDASFPRKAIWREAQAAMAHVAAALPGHMLLAECVGSDKFLRKLGWAPVDGEKGWLQWRS